VVPHSTNPFGLPTPFGLSLSKPARTPFVRSG
jgi:hypothetical protein